MKKLFTMGVLVTGIFGLTACNKEADTPIVTPEEPTTPVLPETPEIPTTPEVVIPGKVLTPEEAEAKRIASEAAYLSEKEENLRLSILDMLAQAEARTAIKKEVFFATQAYNKEQAEKAAAKEALKAEMEATQDAKTKDQTLATTPDVVGIIKDAAALKTAIEKEIFFTEAYNKTQAEKAYAKKVLKAEMEEAAKDLAASKVKEEIKLNDVSAVQEAAALRTAIEKEIYFTEAYNKLQAEKAAAKEILKAELEEAANDLAASKEKEEIQANDITVVKDATAERVAAQKAEYKRITSEISIVKNEIKRVEKDIADNRCNWFGFTFVKDQRLEDRLQRELGGLRHRLDSLERSLTELLSK